MIVPIVSVVGKSDSGKTTFIEKLIPILKGRGYKIATVKHDTHGFELDREGKDTWRHARAGADSVLISGPQKMALIKRVDGEMGLDEIVAEYARDADLVITEGYKRGDKPKIEVSRREVSTDLLCDERELLAIVADHPLDLKVPQFAPDDAEGVADLIEEKILKKARGSEHRVRLIVNGKTIPLGKKFTQDIVAKTVAGLVSALHGTEGAKEIDISIKL
ncbi:MAG: molybdopterin-guanine dinucleotide biosynthesis protein B [bacterium]